MGWNIAATFNIKSLAAGVAVVGCIVGTEKDKTSLGATTCIRVTAKSCRKNLGAGQ